MKLENFLKDKIVTIFNPVVPKYENLLFPSPFPREHFKLLVHTGTATWIITSEPVFLFTAGFTAVLAATPTCSTFHVQVNFAVSC